MTTQVKAIPSLADLLPTDEPWRIEPPAPIQGRSTLGEAVSQQETRSASHQHTQNREPIGGWAVSQASAGVAWYEDPRNVTAVEPVAWAPPVHYKPYITPVTEESQRRFSVNNWPTFIAGVALAALSLFVGGKTIWEQWGSSVVAARSQAQLSATSFRVYDPALAALAEEVEAGDVDESEIERPVGPPAGLESGEQIATITIPAADIEWEVVAGTDVAALKLGPGWMFGTSYPGDPGNAVISGHRTTYGAPFNRIDELEVGDRIIVSLHDGRPDAVYEVRASMVLDPSDIWVAHQTDGARLTLTTCHPEGSAKHRYVVQAELVEGLWVDKALPADQWTPSTPPAA